MSENSSRKATALSTRRCFVFSGKRPMPKGPRGEKRPARRQREAVGGDRLAQQLSDGREVGVGQVATLGRRIKSEVSGVSLAHRSSSGDGGLLASGSKRGMLT